MPFARELHLLAGQASPPNSKASVTILDFPYLRKHILVEYLFPYVSEAKKSLLELLEGIAERQLYLLRCRDWVFAETEDRNGLAPSYVFP